MRKHFQAWKRESAIRNPVRLSSILADEARFIKAWFDNPSVTGAISPSGRALARTMARLVDPAGSGPVIELGPGTGPVTEALLEHGVAQERLVLVEYDPKFCALLARRFPRATIIQGDAYDLARTLAGHLSAPASAVVSSLPLLLRDDADRRAVISDAFALMAEGGPYIQFTYGLTSPVPRGAGMTAQRLRPVLMNLPPAHVWVYRRVAAAAPALPPDLIDRLKTRTRSLRLQFALATHGLGDRIAARAKKLKANRR